MTAAAMKKIIILGATSGIALEVQRLLAYQGSELLLVARSPQRLAEIQADLAARGAQQVLTYSADLASIPQHAAVFEFARRIFPDFDTVLLAYGSMHDQVESENSVDVLLEELQVNYVSATALLTLFAADLEQRRTGCLAAITSVAGDRGRRSNYVYGSAKGALSLRTLCRSGAGCPRHRARPRTPITRRPLHSKSLALHHDRRAADPGNRVQALVVLMTTPLKCETAGPAPRPPLGLPA